MSDAAPRPRPAFPRHAASLLLWRERPSGPEVLMGVRGAGHRFMPNRLVFPGGAVDPADRRAPAATEPDPATLALLSRRAVTPLARGLLVAAARELEEETGLTLGHPPRLDSLRFLCRAVTPKQSSIRFNARFFVAPAEAATGTPTDTHELGAVRFYDLDEALQLQLAPVTGEILRRFRDYHALSEPERARRTERLAYIERRWRSE